MIEEHGVVVLSRLLDALDGKTIRITAETTRGSGSDNDAEFDRRVRKAIDRAHRRAVIGQS